MYQNHAKLCTMNDEYEIIRHQKKRFIVSCTPSSKQHSETKQTKVGNRGPEPPKKLLSVKC